jgi:prophage DNA circulation protein
MSWREQYRPGSFRGVPFRTQSNETSGGRRVETHEYPRRDTPWSEDLGRAADRSTIECFVSGPEYLAQRDALIRALRTAGPGTLVHPWNGTLSVVIPGFSCRDSTDDGGIAYFTIEFVESGVAIAQSGVATGAAAKQVAASTKAAAPASFAGRFSIAGAAAFVEQGASAIIARAGTAAAIAGSLQGGAGGVLRAFEAGLSFLPSSVATLLRSPLQLGQSLVGLVSAVGALGGSPAVRIAALSTLVGFRADPVIGETPQRQIERGNATALVDLVTVTAAAELVRAIADAPIASYQDAVALRDRSAELLEARILETADAGDDDQARAFAELLRVMVADVTARGGTLARIYGYTPARTEPSLVIAARLYGPNGLAARHDDLIARNRVRHPGFVPGGRSIEVLEVPRG